MIDLARKEEGSALISAVMMIIVVLGLGFAVLSYTDNETQAAGYEQQREQAYALAEGALNAQIFELSIHWPSSGAPAPTSCNPADAATTSGCPNPTSLSSGYPVTATTCPSTAPKDPWSSSSTTTNGWTTYVRDDGTSGGTDTSQLYNSTIDSTQPRYDANGDKAMWVRAVGVVDCRMVSVVTKVGAQYSTLSLPEDAIAANGFATSNNGNKIIVDTIGTYAQPTPDIGTPKSGQPGSIDMRCTGLTTGTSGSCDSFRNSPSPGQVYPDTLSTNSTIPTSTLTTTQINELRIAAENNGTYFGTDPNTGYTSSVPCPTSMAQLTGAPVFVEGPCTISIKSTDTANSDTSPGVLVINRGTLTLDGGSTYYGVIYAVNAQGASGTPCDGNDVVTVKGSAEVQGAIIVDGGGTVCFGSSGGNNGTVTNFVFDDRGFSSVVGWLGAAGTPNSFRVLPLGQ